MTIKWKKVSEDRYNDMLGILPPVAFRHDRFMVGEPWDHDANGRPRFSPFVCIDRQCYEGQTAMNVADFKALTRADVLSNVEA